MAKKKAEKKTVQPKVQSLQTFTEQARQVIDHAARVLDQKEYAIFLDDLASDIEARNDALDTDGEEEEDEETDEDLDPDDEENDDE